MCDIVYVAVCVCVHIFICVRGLLCVYVYMHDALVYVMYVCMNLHVSCIAICMRAFVCMY